MWPPGDSGTPVKKPEIGLCVVPAGFTAPLSAAVAVVRQSSVLIAYGFDCISPKLILQVASEVRQRVWQATKLTCSVGVGPNTMIAKICSDLNKPNGQAVVQASQTEVLYFMAGLDVRKVPGIGQVT